MNVVRHRFASGKVDGPDASQVQPSHWNDGHAFTGGAAGDVLVRDPADATFGATWATRSAGGINFDGSTGAIAAPSTLGTIQILSQMTSDATLHGVTPATGTFAIGTILRLTNYGAGTLTLQHMSGSVATGRFANVATAATATRIRGIVGGSTIGGSAEYVWNGGLWLLSAHEQGGPIALPFSPANVSGISAAGISAYYYLHGRDAHVHTWIYGDVPAAIQVLTVAGYPWTFADSSGFYRLIASAVVPAYTGWGANLVRISATAGGLDIVAQSGVFPASAGHNFVVDAMFPIL